MTPQTSIVICITVSRLGHRLHPLFIPLVISSKRLIYILIIFSYKLSGKAAIKAKNVCLSMVDQHKNICQRGIVQLFTHPHPAKRFPRSWFEKKAPKLTQTPTAKSPQHQKHSTSLTASSRLAKSTEHLNLAAATQESAVNTSMRTSPRLSLRPLATPNSCSTNEDTIGSQFFHYANLIELPQDYNPCDLLQSLETQQQFLARSFPRQQSATSDTQQKILSSDLMFEQNSEQHSFTNQLFVEPDRSEQAHKPRTKCHNMLLSKNSIQSKQRCLNQMLLEHWQVELHVMGCLIVELFAFQRLRPLLMNGIYPSFEQRLKACRTVAELHKNDIPKCLRYALQMLLQPSARRQLVSEKGLAPISAVQLLEPIFSNLLVPFPSSYYASYALIRSLRAFDFNSSLLELHTHFQCNGKQCAKFVDIDRKRVLFERKIAECKVSSCSAHLLQLLEPLAYEQFAPLELLLPHFIELLDCEKTSILAAWNLFDPLSQALGIFKTQKYLLQPLMKLYDVESFERGMTSVRNRDNGAAQGQLRFSTSSSFKSRKSVKLYHHSFLLRLIVRFGLKCFLNNFIAPLIEAVGGYKEPEDGTGFHYHSSGRNISRRTSRNMQLSTTADEDNSSLTLMSPEIYDEDATMSADASMAASKQEVEEVFSFDDDGSDRISNSGMYENKSLDSFDTRSLAAEEAKEDFVGNIETTPEKLAISEIIYMYGTTKPSNASFDESDRASLKSQPGNATGDSPITLGPKSPTIEIPSLRRSFHFTAAMDAEIGSRKSVDSFEIIAQAAEEEQKQQLLLKQQNKSAEISTIDEDISEACDSLQASVISKMSEAKAVQNNRISEMSGESLVWLAHRLGPVLTSRYISNNLLRMLSLCYVGQENLLPEALSQSCNTESRENEMPNLNYFTVADARVIGDRSAARVLECCVAIAALFGEEFILLQYFPHISELIALGSRRITSSLEGALISSLQLFKYLIPCLKDSSIMECMQDIFIRSIFLPIVRILGSTQLSMPSGYLGRSVLARKLLDALYALCVRIGSDMSKEHLSQTVLRSFFMIFDKAYGIRQNFDSMGSSIALSPTTADVNLTQNSRQLEEIRDVFGPALAHTAYLTYLRFLGDSIMQRSLLNLDLILTLCYEFEQPESASSLEHYAAPNRNATSNVIDCPGSRLLVDKDISEVDGAANSFGTQVVGNRLNIACTTAAATTASSSAKAQPDHMEVLDMVAYKFEQICTNRHLKGNWLAYWRHEISRSEKDAGLSVQQIKLQSFVGHANSVRSIVALDNENSFISASKDKTVKLWSLRSEGDGSKLSSCQFTYNAHKKSIFSLTYLDALRYVVSCDSGVHLWDPFIGRPLGILDAPKHNAITVVKSLPSPSPLVVAGTAESSIKIIDARCMQYVNEWRVSAAQQGNATVRCLAIAPSGNWTAVGLSSGIIAMLDNRTGMLLKSWRPMECDLLQLAAPNDQQLISSALDHSLAVWNASDGRLHYQLKPPPEPAHFLQTFDSELIYATTGNRIGIYSDLSNSHAMHSITKLRSETFRGVLTSLAVLPLNRAFLAGNESGNIVLLC